MGTLQDLYTYLGLYFIIYFILIEYNQYIIKLIFLTETVQVTIKSKHRRQILFN